MQHTPKNNTKHIMSQNRLARHTNETLELAIFNHKGLILSSPDNSLVSS